MKGIDIEKVQKDNGRVSRGGNVIVPSDCGHEAGNHAPRKYRSPPFFLPTAVNKH